MTILGIDYGAKRVGTSVSDASETLAFPNGTLENTKTLVTEMCALANEKGARMIVIGKSEDMQGRDNPIMERITAFKKELETVLALPVVFQEEYWTTEEARRFQGRMGDTDASAAALILQRFLDKQRAQ